VQYPVFIYNFATILFSFLHLIKQEKHMFRKLASVVESVICPHILRSLICFCLPSIDMCWPVERICGGYGFILASDKKCLSRRKTCHVPRGSTVQRAPDCSPRIRIWVLNCWGYLFCLTKFMINYTLLAFWSLRSPIFCILCIMFVSLCLVNDDLHPVVCIDPRFVPWFFGRGQLC